VSFGGRGGYKKEKRKGGMKAKEKGAKSYNKRKMESRTAKYFQK
jgi:hypothetical protein